MIKKLIFLFFLLLSYSAKGEQIFPELCKNENIYEVSNELSDKFNYTIFDFKTKLFDIPLYRRNTEGSLDQSIGDSVEPRIQLVSDFNNDGIDDLFIEYMSTIIAPIVLYGTNDDSFEMLKIQDFDQSAARKTIRKAALADFNKDGFVDIYGFTTGDHYQEKGISEKDVLLINQQGKGFKSIEVKESRKNAGNHGGFVIDIDNDGWIDIVPLDEINGKGSYPIRNIKGKNFELMKNHISSDVMKYYVEDGDAADLNNDGFQDMVVSVEEKSDVHPNQRNKINTMRIIYGDGDFDFKNNKVIKLGTSWIDKDTAKLASKIFGSSVKSGTSNINLMDINADGKIDILISEFIDDNKLGWRTSGFKAYINKGNCFSDETNLFFPNQKTNRNIANEAFTQFIGNFYHKDINNDGFKDLVLRNWWDEYSYFEKTTPESFPYIFMNHDNQKYLPIKFKSGEIFKFLHSLTPGDFNGDGAIDFVGIDHNRGGARVEIFYFDKQLSNF